MHTFIKNIKFLFITLFITTIGFSQNNQKVEKLLISPPEMVSTSSVVIHFKEKGKYIFQIIKNKNIIFSRKIMKAKQINFKIDFSDYELGQYQIVILDRRNNIIYDEILVKKITQ